VQKNWLAIIEIDGKKYEDVFKAPSRYQATMDAFHTWGPRNVVSIQPKE
jgi:hypothetical protein